MKLPASIVTAALCTAFATGARAQDANEPASLDPNAAFDPGADPSAMYPAPPSVVADPSQDPNAGGGLSVVPAAPDQPVDESAAYVEPLDPNAYVQFQNELAPYGDWYDDPQYGRVWSPSVNIVGADFSPYATGGNWSLSQYGYTWSSDYVWGWAPFHYGRWVTLAQHGWAWVPGTTWGPAWVSWRAGNGYAGWAPLPPAGASLAAPGVGASCWRFVPVGQLGVARPSYLPPSAVASIYPRTAWFNPARAMTYNQQMVRYNPGPVGIARQSAMRLGPLPQTAMPRPNIVPRYGTPMNAGAQLPWSAVAGTQSYWARRPAYAAPTPPGYGQPVYAQPNYQGRGWGGGGWGRGPAVAYPSGGYPSVGAAPPGYPSSGYGGYGGGGHWGGGGFGGGGGHWGGGGNGGFAGGGGGFAGGGGGHWGGGGGRRGR